MIPLLRTLLQKKMRNRYNGGMENEKGNSVGDQEKHSKGEASDDVSLNSDIAGLCYFSYLLLLFTIDEKILRSFSFMQNKRILFSLSPFFAILPGKLSWLFAFPRHGGDRCFTKSKHGKMVENAYCCGTSR